MFEPWLARRSRWLRSMGVVEPGLLVLSMLTLSFGATACGDDESSDTTTNEATPAEAGPPVVVSVELGEEGARYFLKLDKPSVPAGPVTFKIDNVGTTH